MSVKREMVGFPALDLALTETGRVYRLTAFLQDEPPRGRQSLLAKFSPLVS